MSLYFFTMGIEIERKYLVKPSWKPLQPGTLYMQGYLSSDPDRTVRVRLAADRGFITVKGRSKGSVRAEFEYEIPVVDARQLLEQLVLKPAIVKTRYLEKSGPHTWEVDVFERENAGLIVAEIELSSEDEEFVKPDWVGEEVTDDHRYQNSSLATKPYSSW